jgi:beta-glucosidase
MTGMDLSVEQQAALTSGAGFWETTAAGDVPAITMTDGPHGVRLATGGLLDGVPATAFPPAVALGSTWDAGLAHRVGVALGKEARALGVAVLLGPGVNLKRSPLGGRNFEYLSEDPQLTGALAAAWVQGLQSQGVGASLKHFAVNNQETDRMRVSADVDERPLREVYLRAFRHVVEHARPWTVMCAYNRVNGVHASQNAWLLTDVLRGEWGFDGVVVSDWGAVVDRVEAVRAGLDLTMPGPADAGDRALVEAMAGGSLPAEALERAAARVAALAARAATEPRPAYDADAHHALAREVAGRAIVLLKNAGDLLPLPAEGTSVAVIGEPARTPRFQGGGSSQVTPTRVDDALTAITGSTAAAVTFAASGADAVAAARAADVAVVFAASSPETEGADRTDLALPADQVALIGQVAAANPRTVVVLSNGGVVTTTEWEAPVPAVLEGWLLGQAGGSAVADVLFGRVNPSGRLAETIPLRLSDHPSYLGFPGEAGHVRYGEGLFVGYRGFDARELPVAYPFGHGLSYTTFGYGPASVTVEEAGDLVVTVPVTNTGTRAGREVVQVYLGRPDSALQRPRRELRGFAVLDLPAGTTETAVVRVARPDLGVWHPVLRRWVVEGGSYEVAVGASSRDLRSFTTVTVPGDDIRVPLTAESTIGEWLADPRGAEVLSAAFASVASGAGAMTDPGTLVLVSGLPLSRLGAVGQELLGPRELAALVRAANPD